MPSPQNRSLWGVKDSSREGTMLLQSLPAFFGSTWAGTTIPPLSCRGITLRRAVLGLIWLLLRFRFWSGVITWRPTDLVILVGVTLSSGSGSRNSGWSRCNTSCWVD